MKHLSYSYKSWHGIPIASFINLKFQVSLQINEVLLYNKGKQARKGGVTIKSKKTSS